ncbi:alpha/beta hydrolase [Xanthocytophaga agilis]|uniref:Alpha/beta hydrolase n=1 Tax=Xanthocytophaga agilis TaxID=3048010 RepID=A0AAE3R0W6_9BACT|nr:alpha/beta hydrolase [Xanthocytophaga agilis]MDJ1501606.1 alpha/beta hydrolase [Xanthocytophaga agilis]
MTTVHQFSSLSQARSRDSTSRKEFIEVEKNVKLHITDLGEGKPVVLIHGWPLSDAMYEYQYAELIQKGYRVIGITLRGFGKSDKPYGQYNFDIFADDIKVTLEELGIQDAVLGGFSMGGAIATRYMVRHNGEHIRKLALFGAATPKWTSGENYPFGFTQEEVNAMIEQSQTNRAALYTTFGSIFAATETSLPAGLDRWLVTIQWEASPYAVTQCLIALRDGDQRAELSAIKVPVAIFHGVQDKIVPFSIGEQAQQLFENAYLVRFENSGHGLFVEEREKFNQELITFLETR